MQAKRKWAIDHVNWTRQVWTLYLSLMSPGYAWMRQIEEEEYQKT